MHIEREAAPWVKTGCTIYLQQRQTAGQDKTRQETVPHPASKQSIHTYSRLLVHTAPARSKA